MIYVYINDKGILGVSDNLLVEFYNSAGKHSKIKTVDEPHFNGDAIVMSDGTDISDMDSYLSYLEKVIFNDGKRKHSDPIFLDTIEDLDKKGLQYFQYGQVRAKMKDIVVSILSGGDSLTDRQIPIVCKWILCKYATRLEVLGDERDEKNWKTLVEENIGYTKESLKGRQRIIEEMRQFIGQYLRREEMSKADIDDFYISVAAILDSFQNTNSPNFWEWVNNETGTPYEDDGFKQKSYYSNEKRDKLNDIMKGNY